MSFVYPWVLYFLPLLLVFFSVKKSSKIEQVFSKEVLEKLQFGSSNGKNLKFYLLVLSFMLMIIALSRPVILDEKKEVSQKSFNFIIALDISKSMDANDIFPTRLAFAKKAIYEIMDKVSEANIALIAYANDAFLVSPFSNDFKSIKFLLSNLDSNSLSSKGTQILSALKATNRIFKSSKDNKKVILLVSDGADGKDLKKIKEYIQKNSITLHVLSIGTKKGTTLKNFDGSLIKDKNENIVISKRDDSLIKVLNTGAYLSSSGELDKLDWLVEQIKKSANLKDIKIVKIEGAKELFYYPLVLSLFFIFLAFNSLKIPFLALLLFVQTDGRAGILDFVDIYKANKSYEKLEYKEAEKGFAKIDNKNAKYNQANALYKQKKYKKALKIYDSISGFSKDMEHKRLHNIGNTYANLGKIDEAIKSYQEALKFKDDKDTKENLRYVKKIKKKEQEQKKQNKKGNQKPKKKKKKKKQKSPNGKNENKNKKKQKKKEEKKAQESPKKEQKKISEAEAKKWDKRMNKKKFKTKPMTLKKGEKNEIYW